VAALLLVGAAAWLARAGHAQEMAPGAPSGDIGPAFTYQGRLVQNGAPISGTCDLRFNLFEDGSLAPPQVAGPVDRLNVPVRDGYFSANINFGDDAFTGAGRQLQISVRCPAGSGDYTLLSPMVQIMAAPYAIGLMPGAVISGNVSTGLEVRTSAGSTAQALLAHASAQTGQSSGVWGSTDSTDGGAGVVGRAEADSGQGYGVFGASFSPGGAGVYGMAPTTGTVGVATASNGTGVYGASASGYGVYGKANPPDGYGIYSDGNAYVKGKLFWDARTSYVSVSTAAFIPELGNDGGHVEYDNYGYYLQNEASSAEWFVAPVQLPHGATVTELRVGWRDGSNTQSTVYLRRRSMIDVTGTFETMAQVASVGSLGGDQEGVWSDDTIDNAAVDNEHYTYYLEVGLHDLAEDIQLKGVVIVYQITQPY